MNIRAGMSVINSLGEHIGRVATPGEDYLEIEMDTAGNHYWVPMSLVRNTTEDEVCLEGSGDVLSSRWLNKNPGAFKDSLVDEASEESFPGSDPPSFNPQKS